MLQSHNWAQVPLLPGDRCTCWVICRELTFEDLDRGCQPWKDWWQWEHVSPSLWTSSPQGSQYKLVYVSLVLLSITIHIFKPIIQLKKKKKSSVLIAERKPMNRDEAPFHATLSRTKYSTIFRLLLDLFLLFGLCLLVLSLCLFFNCSACHLVITLDFFFSLLLAFFFFPFYCLSQAECKTINIPSSP